MGTERTRTTVDREVRRAFREGHQAGDWVIAAEDGLWAIVGSEYDVAPDGATYLVVTTNEVGGNRSRMTWIRVS